MGAKGLGEISYFHRPGTPTVTTNSEISRAWRTRWLPPLGEHPPGGCCDASYQQEPPGAEKFRCNHFSRFEHEVCMTSFNLFRQSQLNIFSPPPLLLAMLRRCSSCRRPDAPLPPFQQPSLPSQNHFPRSGYPVNRVPLP